MSSIELYNFGMYLIFFALYILVGVMVGMKVNKELSYYEPPSKTSDDVSDITLDLNTRFIRVYSSEIGLFFGLMWPITVVFLLALDLGHYIYFALIYNGNEEDRIASWLV